MRSSVTKTVKCDLVDLNGYSKVVPKRSLEAERKSGLVRKTDPCATGASQGAGVKPFTAQDI